MIILKCKCCSKPLGEISKGKLKKNTVVICKECYDIIEIKETANKLNNINSNNSFPDIFKDIFKGKL
jgi:hypothetical protein